MPFRTGLEDFNIPFPQQEPEQPAGGRSEQQLEVEQPDIEVSDGGGDASAFISRANVQQQKLDAARLLAEHMKQRSDYRRMVRQARFFLPRTLEQIGGEFGAQGGFFGSGRRRAQQEAMKKTRFDIKQAKADVKHHEQMTGLQQRQIMLEMAKIAAAEQEARRA